MSCSPEQLKDYFLGEMSPAERPTVESHLALCVACRDELASLGNTRTVLLSLPDEEPPRRIAFVSDKVFEPRWWQRIWRSGPQLGFLSAAMLATAILIHAFVVRPEGPSIARAGITGAHLQPTASPADLDNRVRAEVARAMTENETKQMSRVLELVDAKLRQTDEHNDQTLVLIREYLERIDKRNAVVAKRVLYE